MIRYMNMYTNCIVQICVCASQVVLVGKNLPANAGDKRDMGVIPGSGRSPGRGHGNPFQYSSSIPVFLPGESHGQRSLAGYSPWNFKELDITEQHTLSLSCPWIVIPIVWGTGQFGDDT